VTKIMDGVMLLAGKALVNAGPDVASVIVATWNACVGALRDPSVVPDKRINDLAGLLWTLVSSRTVCTAMIAGVPTLSFMALERGSRQVALIAIPEDWVAHFAKDPWMQLGATVYSASKARDYWSGRVATRDVNQRAMAFEAILLRLAAADESEAQPFKPNEYQAKVLAAFPSLPAAFDYEPEPFDLESAKRRFDDFSERGIQAPTQ